MTDRQHFIRDLHGADVDICDPGICYWIHGRLKFQIGLEEVFKSKAGNDQGRESYVGLMCKNHER